MDSRIEERLTRFRGDLCTLATTEMVRKHVTSGDCYLLDDDQHYRLRAAVAANFDVHPNEIFVVGSGKLGFSISPKKRYLPFGDRSDLDLAIVSSALFDRFWEALVDHADMTSDVWPAKQSFEGYFLRGWIRPDKLPPAETFALRSEWWEFFRVLTQGREYGAYQIRAGIYRTHFFLERYQEIAVKLCQHAARPPL